MHAERKDGPSVTHPARIAVRVAAAVSLNCGLLLFTPVGAGDVELASSHGSCAVCHRAEGGFADCLDCHAYVLELPGEGGSPSGVVSGHVARGSSGGIAPGSEEFVERIECVTCHDPHAEDVLHMLRVRHPAEASGDTRDPCSDLCLSCHTDFGQTNGQGGHFARHPVGIVLPPGFSMRGTPYDLRLLDVRGTADGRDDLIVCTTCHTPHVAPHPDMLRWPAEEQREACATCHEEGLPPASRNSR